VATATVFASHSLEALAVELVEVDVVGLLGDEQVEHGPTKVRQPSSPGKRPISLVGV
jgi:hypothetical protein